jgi:hypothetical protein
MENIIYDIKEGSVENLALLLAENKVQPQCSIQVQLEECESIIDIFEYALTLFMELICTYTTDLKDIDTSLINTQLLESFAPYMKSVGIILHLEELKDPDDYIQYYCRIALRATEENLFILKKINKNYHFIFGPMITTHRMVLDKWELTKFYAIYKLKNQNVVRISFSLCDHKNH